MLVFNWIVYLEQLLVFALPLLFMCNQSNLKYLGSSLSLFKNILTCFISQLLKKRGYTVKYFFQTISLNSIWCTLHYFQLDSMKFMQNKQNGNQILITSWYIASYIIVTLLASTTNNDYIKSINQVKKRTKRPSRELVNKASYLAWASSSIRGCCT